MTVEELVAVMLKIEKTAMKKDDCYSTQDIADTMGITQGAALKHVKKALDKGTMIYAGKRLGVGIDGRKAHSSVYRLIKKKGKKKGGGKK